MIAGRVRLQEWRRGRRINRALRRVLAGPRRGEFGAIGRSIIVPPARVNNPDCIFIGDGVVIHEGVWLSVARVPGFPDPRLTVGDRVRVGRFCQFSVVGLLVIKDDVLIGDQVQIGDTFHQYENVDLPAARQPMASPVPVTLMQGCVVGNGAIILPGITVGAGAYVSDGAVVTKDVPPRVKVAGNPARPV